MTVQELIDKLSTYPKDEQVVVNNDLGHESFNIHICYLNLKNKDGEFDKYPYIFGS